MNKTIRCRPEGLLKTQLSVDLELLVVNQSLPVELEPGVQNKGGENGRIVTSFRSTN